MKFRKYEDYIPTKQVVAFDGILYMIDNHFIYMYDILTGVHKKILNYPKEFNLKNLFPLKLEVKTIEENNKVIFFILIEDENQKKIVIVFSYDVNTNTMKYLQKIEQVIDLVLLGDDEFYNRNFALMIKSDKQTLVLYDYEQIPKNEIRDD